MWARQDSWVSGRQGPATTATPDTAALLMSSEGAPPPDSLGTLTNKVDQSRYPLPSLSP